MEFCGTQADHLHAQALYESGNEMFFAGNRQEAAAKYSSALNLVTEDSPLRLRLLLNRSLCRLSDRDYEGAVEDCSGVILTDPGNIKALFRRSEAYKLLNRFSEAAVDSDTLAHMPQLSPDLRSKAFALLRDIQRLAKMDELARGLDKMPASFVTDHQSIKLMINSSFNESIEIGKNYAVRLCLGNEFGLFRRDLLPCGDDCMQLSCSVVYLSTAVRDLSPANVFVLRGSSLGEIGKVDLVFKIVCNMEISCHVPTYICLKFECRGTLTSGKSVLPVITLPLRLFSNTTLFGERVHDKFDNDSKNYEEELCATARSIEAHCIREFGFQNPVQINSLQRYLAFECPGYLGIGGKVWDSSYVLLNYLSDNQSLIESKIVFELGSGTGLVGISLSAMNPSEVYLSDLLQVLPLMAANIMLNSENLAHLRRKYHALAYSWGSSDYQDSEGIKNSIQVLFEKCDVAIASDVVYEPDLYEILVKSIDFFLSSGNKNKQVVLAHRHRNPEDHKFFDMILNHSDMVLEQQQLHKSTQLLSCKDSNAIDLEEHFNKQVSEDTKIFIIRRKFNS